MDAQPTTSPSAPGGRLAMVLNVLALLCGIWFLPFGANWSWAIALFLGYPVALLGWIFWFIAKKQNPTSKFNRVVLWVLIAGLVVSVGSLLLTK